MRRRSLSFLPLLAMFVLALAASPGRAARTSNAGALKNLRYNMHNALLRSYLHKNRGKLAPAPGWLRHIGITIGRNARLGMGYNFNFYLVDLPQANAMTTARGTIIVHQGMLDLGLTKDEIGALMAHEVAHLARDHAIQRLLRGVQARRLAAYNVQRYGKSSAQLSYLTDQIKNLKFNREEENEADRIGLVLLQKSRYDPSAMSTLMRKMHDFKKAEGGGSTKYPYLASHPPTSERLRKIDAALRTMKPFKKSRRKSKKTPSRPKRPAAVPSKVYNFGLTGWQVTVPPGFRLKDSRDKSSGFNVYGELHWEKTYETLSRRTGRPRSFDVKISAYYGTRSWLRTRYRKKCPGKFKSKLIKGRLFDLNTYRFRCREEDGYQLNMGDGTIVLLFEHGGDGAKRKSALKDFVSMQKSLFRVGEPLSGPKPASGRKPASGGGRPKIRLLR